MYISNLEKKEEWTQKNWHLTTGEKVILIDNLRRVTKN